MRVMAPIPTSPIFRSSAYRTSSASVIGCVLPSISSTSLPAGVSDCSRNIQRSPVVERDEHVMEAAGVDDLLEALLVHPPVTRTQLLFALRCQLHPRQRL